MTQAATPTRRAQDAMNDYWTRRAVPYDEHQQRPERLAADREAWGEVWTAALGEEPLEVLDVGTGSGYVACTLAGLGHRVTGIDLAEGMLERARLHAAGMPNPPRFEPGDAVDPGYPHGSFDALVNRYVMWTLREPDRALARWRELIRPGGTLAVVDSPWFPCGLHVGASEEFARAYGDEVRAALPLAEAGSIEATATAIEAAGFRDVEVRPLTTLLELDKEYGVAPNHEVQVQYLVRGVNPA
jgi:SAM-dependent methyltransferase